jgi:hypothetical protein
MSASGIYCSNNPSQILASSTQHLKMCYNIKGIMLCYLESRGDQNLGREEIDSPH